MPLRHCGADFGACVGVGGVEITYMPDRAVQMESMEKAQWTAAPLLAELAAPLTAVRQWWVCLYDLVPTPRPSAQLFSACAMVAECAGRREARAWKRVRHRLLPVQRRCCGKWPPGQRADGLFGAAVCHTAPVGGASRGPVSQEMFGTWCKRIHRLPRHTHGGQPHRQPVGAN